MSATCFVQKIQELEQQSLVPTSWFIGGLVLCGFFFNISSLCMSSVEFIFPQCFSEVSLASCCWSKKILETKTQRLWKLMIFKVIVILVYILWSRKRQPINLKFVHEIECSLRISSLTHVDFTFSLFSLGLHLN